MRFAKPVFKTVEVQSGMRSLNIGLGGGCPFIHQYFRVMLGKEEHRSCDPKSGIRNHRAEGDSLAFAVYRIVRRLLK